MNFAVENMKGPVLKYRSITGSLTLVCYLLIFSLNVFHFHTIEYSNIEKIESASSANPNSKLILIENGCVVYLNFISLHNSTIPNFSSILLSYKNPTSLPDDLSINIRSTHLNANNLRAPPAFS